MIEELEERFKELYKNRDKFLKCVNSLSCKGKTFYAIYEYLPIIPRCTMGGPPIVVLKITDYFNGLRVDGKGVFGMGNLELKFISGRTCVIYNGNRQKKCLKLLGYIEDSKDVEITLDNYEELLKESIIIYPWAEIVLNNST